MVGGLEFVGIGPTSIHQHRDAAQQAAEEELGALRVVLVGEAERVRSVGCGGEVGGEVGVVSGLLLTGRIAVLRG